MSCFPLYDNLVSLRRNKRFLTRIEKRQLVERVHALDQDGHNKIMAIILYHQQLHGGRFVPLNWDHSLEPVKTLSINLTSLPVALQEIVEIFVEKHLGFMEEEKQRQ